MNRFREFDQLRTELELEIDKINSANLDQLMPAYEKSVKLRASCEEILEEAKKYAEKCLTESHEKLEWRGFAETKKRIEELDSLLTREERLDETLLFYREFCLLVRQYQEKLETMQNRIEKV